VAKRSGRRRGRQLGRIAALAAVGGVVAAVAVRARAGRGWADGEDPCGPEGIALPEGAERTVTTDDGAELVVFEAGPVGGPTVVLPHCWTGTKEIWAPVARRLVAAGHRVVLYDQRGHARSTLGSGAMDVDRLGDDLLAVLATVEGDDLVLAGHSMGGMTIQALAAHHPEVIRSRVRGVALVATATRTIPGLGARIPPLLLNVAVGDRASGAIARQGLSVTRGSVGQRAHRSHVQATYDAFAATPGAVRSGFLLAMARMDYRRGLAEIRVPTTILVGTHDRLTPPARARELRDGIAGSELIVLPGLGHMLPLEAPDEIAEAIGKLTLIAA
jgi:pimeloyl-ACP methyl ester carboxylesterase